MPDCLKNLWKFFRYYFRAKKCYGWPKRSEVLIFDAMGQDVLLEYLTPWAPEILHVNGEKIYVPVLVISLFRAGKRFSAYADCFIDRVRPRLIVTFIDNSPAFCTIAARHNEIKTMLVQNGVRGAEFFDTLKSSTEIGARHKVDYMMTFGRNIGERYALHIEGSAVPMGSLKNNRIPKLAKGEKDSIAFISQFRNTEGFDWGGRFRSQEEFFERADRAVLPFVVNYAKTHNKHFFIVPSTEHHSRDPSGKKEAEYYKWLLGVNCEFSAWHWQCGSYNAIDRAEVVVTIDSTLGYESAARGNKTAIFPVRGQVLDLPDRTFGWPGDLPDEGPFWTNNIDEAAFTSILDHLFAIDAAQWKAELLRCDFSQIMIHDPGNSIFRSTICKAMAAATIPGS